MPILILFFQSYFLPTFFSLFTFQTLQISFSSSSTQLFFYLTVFTCIMSCAWKSVSYSLLLLICSQQYISAPSYIKKEELKKQNTFLLSTEKIQAAVFLRTKALLIQNKGKSFIGNVNS